MQRDLTTGSVLKNITYFSLPYLFSYFLQTLYGMADLFIIGQFEGVAATTAVSVGSQVMHMLTVILVGLAIGATVSVGQSVGAKNNRQAAGCVGNTVTLFLALSVVLTGLLLLLARPIVLVMSTPQQAVDGTVAYLTVCFLGIPFITAYNIISAIFRGMGDSKTPMFFIAVACAANIGLDYLFIGFLHLGPAGAALGTTLAQAISVAVALVTVKKRRLGLALTKADFKPQRHLMAPILKVGLPIALQDGLIQIAFILITVIANGRGLNDAAAVGIVEKIISFLFLAPSTLLSAVSALGAQSFGAGKPQRAKATLGYAVLIAGAFGLVVSVFMQFFAAQTVGLFTASKTVAAAGGQYLRGYVWDCVFAGIHFSFSGYFCACQKSGLSFMHNIIAIVCMRVPGVYVTSKLYPSSLLPMGLATAAGSLISVLICVVAFGVLNKKEKAVLAGGAE